MSVALADLPADSGAGWANRDQESLYRRPAADPAPARRPPVADPLRDELEDNMADSGSWNAFAAPSAGRGQPAPEPEFGPAPPATSGRTAFGVSAGPISGNWRDGRPTSGAPAAPQSAPPDLPLPVRSQGRPTPAPDPDAGYPPPPADPRWDDGYPAQPSDQDRWMDEPPPVRSVRPASVLERSRGTHSARPAYEDDHIGDVLDGPGREIRPHRAPRHPAAPVPAAGMPAEPRRGRGVMVAGVALTAAVLFGGTVAGVAYFAGPDKNLTSVLELGVGKGGERTAVAPIEGRTAAAFELVSAVNRVTVRTEDLGDDLYRMTTAGDSGVLPKPVLEQDRVRLQLTGDGSGGTAEVEVVLNAKVMWTLRFSGAADEQIVNLRSGKVGGIDVAGGARRTAIQLPEAAGTVPLRVTGAVDELAMTSPAGNPVRVQVKGGAKTVAAGARTLRDVPPGSTVTPKGWATNDRYDVEADSRVTLLSIETAE
ncbi:hypothetical protein Asp14428_31770 [Actinoplanes sp. NBRC 14428]|nr:hypothetical protein Asp14428_31770 [Actinoplanes sp. NBRC 14428]